MVARGHAAWRALRLAGRRLSPSRLASLGPWLVVAPHPDDETLGAGLLIAALAADGRAPRVAFLTDGAASHPGAEDWPPLRVAMTRSGEARGAMRTLGAPAERMLRLGWPDAAPHEPGSPGFERSCRRLAGLCRRIGVRALATTWRNEDHCDHQAAYALADAVGRGARGRIAVFEYLVWGWSDPELVNRARGYRIFAIDAAVHVPKVRRALSRHRSQLWPLIPRPGFSLPTDMAGLAGRNPLILLEGPHAS